MKDEFYTTKEIAFILRVNLKTLYRWLTKGGEYEKKALTRLCLPRVGNKILIKKKEFDKWLKEKKND